MFSWDSRTVAITCKYNIISCVLVLLSYIDSNIISLKEILRTLNQILIQNKTNLLKLIKQTKILRITTYRYTKGQK